MWDKEEAACEEEVVYERCVERVRPQFLHEQLLFSELCAIQSVCHFGYEFRLSDCCTSVFNRVHGTREPPGGRLRREQLLLVEEELLNRAPTLGQLVWREAERNLEERVVGVPRDDLLVELARPQDSDRMPARRDARRHSVEQSQWLVFRKGSLRRRLQRRVRSTEKKQ